MKILTLALLATAAISSLSTSARADELGDLKAQIKALNARVASLEATPSVPAGFGMVSFSKGRDITVPGVYFGNEDIGPAQVVAIMPATDQPSAGASVLTWSGWVRGAAVTGRTMSDTNLLPLEPDSPTRQSFTDIRVRGAIVVTGKTDTAVGEVGAKLSFQTGANFNDSPGIFNGGNSGAVTTDAIEGFWGWWKMTPNLTLGAGIDNSLAYNTKSFDNSCACYYENTGGGIVQNPNGDKPAQIRLSYTDGPMGFAVAVEDSNNFADNSSFGVAAKALWSGDTFSAELGGGYWGNTIPDGTAAWNVNAGAGVGIGSMATLSAAIGYGSDFSGVTQITASGFARLNVSDKAHAELGVTRAWNTKMWDQVLGTTIGGGVYYDPVTQLTIGAEGSYVFGGVNDGTYIADIVNVFRF